MYLCSWGSKEPSIPVGVSLEGLASVSGCRAKAEPGFKVTSSQ